MQSICPGYKLRSGLAMVVAVLGLILVTTAAAEAAPVNDNFLNAQAINGVSGSLNGTNVGATKQAGEPNHGGNYGGSSVWYKFTAPGTGVLKLKIGLNEVNTLMGVYTGSQVGNLTLVGQGDDTMLSGYFSDAPTLSIGVRTGTTYYIAVDGKNRYDFTGADNGTFDLTYSFVNVDANDSFASAVPLYEFGGTNMITGSNIGAGKEPGEPAHMGNQGGRSIWYKYRNPTPYARRISFTIESAGGATISTGVKSVFAVYTGNSVSTLTPILNAPSHSSFWSQRFSFTAQANTTYYVALDGYDDGAGADSGTYRISYGVAADLRNSDFDNDGQSDLTVFRPSNGTWYSLDSGTNTMRAINWGMNGDKPLLQKSSDLAGQYTIYRPDTGNWYVTVRGTPFHSYNFGLGTDIPFILSVADASGRSGFDFGVFRPETGVWWIYNGQGAKAIHFGQMGDIPVTADFNGDGNHELTIFRPSEGNWYFYDVETGQSHAIHFGSNGDRPVPADFDADGRADVAVFRPSNGTWYVQNSSDGAVRVVKFGMSGDVPQAADYDNDGKADFAVFRSGTWWVQRSGSALAKAYQWGLSTDVPVASPFK